jgi:apolipoprotein N-acyltransferase
MAPGSPTHKPPGSGSRNRWRYTLALLSGLMLGFSFPPSQLGVLACVGLVPLLIVLGDLEGPRGSFRYMYLSMVVFHIITLNWTGGYAHGNDPYMMIAGAITMTIHPFFYFLPLGFYMLIKKHLGAWAAITAFPFLWVGYEYSHMLSEWSFPWLTIGNSQTYDLSAMQFVSFTGVLGLSFWIVVLNVIAYILYSGIASGAFPALSWKAGGLAVLFFGLYLVPKMYGSIVLATAPPREAPLSDAGQETTIGIIQSNIDPWAKWKGSADQALDTYIQMTDSLLSTTGGSTPDLVLWPETAVPYYLLQPSSRPLLSALRQNVDRWNTAILTGFPHVRYYTDSTLAPPSAKRSSITGERYDVYNAAAWIQPGVDTIRWYGKMKMVPLAERVPYADAFYYLDFLRWGVGIGGWQIGPDSVIFVEENTGVRFCTMICYESTYPGFVAAFVRKGAEFIAIITIDSWWDRMSGAFQHQQFSILRAIENRRWVARCAVGGISCFIDPYGRVYDRTGLFTRTAILRTIEARDQMTYYTLHGDQLGQLCLLLTALFLASVAGKTFHANIRRRQWEQIS